MDKITDQNGNVVQEIGTNIRRQVISESASETIRQIMEFEVGDGTQGGGATLTLQATASAASPAPPSS